MRNSLPHHQSIHPVSNCQLWEEWRLSAPTEGKVNAPSESWQHKARFIPSGLGWGALCWQNSSLSFEPKLRAEEQRSHSPVPRDHTAAQHLPIHSALLAHAATWHATVPCLEAVYTGIRALFLGKMIIFFLHRISRLFKGNTAHLKLLKHRSMGSMLQLVWVCGGCL